MTDNDKVPTWFLWVWENFPAVLMAGVFVAVIAFAAVGVVESRLSGIEDQLNYAPARNFVPPNLDDYDAGDSTAEQLTDRKVFYVPAYSHIYCQGGSAFPLETTLSLRNVDPRKPIYVESVEYYDTDGKLARTFVERLIKLSPLQTIEFLIERRDSSGGSGANFLVRWGSKSNVNKPLIETVMVGTAGAQGICLGRTGVELSIDEGDGG